MRTAVRSVPPLSCQDTHHIEASAGTRTTLSDKQQSGCAKGIRARTAHARRSDCDTAAARRCPSARSSAALPQSIENSAAARRSPSSGAVALRCLRRLRAPVIAPHRFLACRSQRSRWRWCSCMELNTMELACPQRGWTSRSAATAKYGTAGHTATVVALLHHAYLSTLCKRRL